MGRVAVRRPVLRVDTTTGERTRRPDLLAGEEPLEIRTTGGPLTTTMRTPGHDLELVHGWLWAEGVIDRAEQVQQARYCDGAVVLEESGVRQNTYNVMAVTLEADAERRARDAVRQFGTTSACGVCGQASIDAVRDRLPEPLTGDLRVDAATIAALPDRLRAAQPTFDKTGGLHGAGLWDPATDHLEVREDVGRHNAADKVIGAEVISGAVNGPAVARERVLVLSGRASFELVQKAAAAGVPVVVAVSAPSSLAVDLAQDLGMTLCGFVRGGRMNVYAGEQRLV